MNHVNVGDRRKQISPEKVKDEEHEPCKSR